MIAAAACGKTLKLDEPPCPSERGLNECKGEQQKGGNTGRDVCALGDDQPSDDAKDDGGRDGKTGI